MKRNLSDIKAMLLALCLVLSIAGATTVFAQNTKPSVSKEEAAAADKVQKAADIPAKFLAADEFVKKYPKSTLRLGMAQHIADQIRALKDDRQRVAFGEQFFNIFTETNETDEILPTLIDAYLDAKKYDEAFQTAESYFSRYPDSLRLLTDLTIQGSNLARQQNPKFVKQSATYGNKAIAIIESDKKPANVNDADWAIYKTSLLAGLYQSVGVLSLINSDSADAKAKLEKAIAINPTDPLNYYYLGILLDSEYQTTAKAHQAAAPGKTKDDLLAKATSQLDLVIDVFAHTIALAEGKAELQGVSTQIRSILEPYYKFRHNNKLDGLQELINKYKTKP